MRPLVPPAERAAPPKKDQSGLALVLTLVGVCCFPLGIVGGVLALGAISAARREGRPTPVAAVLSLVFLAIGLLVAAGAVFAGAMANAQKTARSKAVDARLKGKLDAATLDAAVACDLATASLVNDFYESVECPGTFTAGPISKLEGVTAKKDQNSEKTTHTFCFARAHRWFVISEPGDGVCPPVAPAVPPGQPSTDDEFQDEERALRQAEANRGDREQVEHFMAQLTSTRALLESGEHAERACPKWQGEVKASYVDFDALPGGRQAEQTWKLLSDSNLRTILDSSEAISTRAHAIAAAQGKSAYLAVFHAEDAKDLPVAKGSSYAGGEFDGWLTVVDLTKNAVACDTHLLFRSSDSVGGGVRLKFVPKKSTADQVEDDFESKFKDAARAAAKKMSGDTLRLGVGFLD